MSRIFRSILKWPRRLINLFRKKEEREINYFLLLKQPNSARVKIGVVLDTGFYDLCTSSVSSKQGKEDVKSMNITNVTMYIEIGYIFKLFLEHNGHVVGLSFHYTDEKSEYETRKGDPIRNLTGKFFISVRTSQLESDWGESRKDISDWIAHFKYVFNIREITCLYISEEEIEVKYIKECLKDHPFMYLFVNRCFMGFMGEEYFKEVLRDLIPRSQLQMMNRYPSEIRPKILIQNISMITGIITFKTTLNDLLLANSEYIELAGYDLSTKDVNRFLKLWILGCNPRMKYIILYCYDVLRIQFNNMGIFKDIQFEPIPDTFLRRYPIFFNDGDRYYKGVIKGGFDIRRNDGTLATVHFIENGMELFVWDQ